MGQYRTFLSSFIVEVSVIPMIKTVYSQLRNSYHDSYDGGQPNAGNNFVLPSRVCCLYEESNYLHTHPRSSHRKSRTRSPHQPDERRSTPAYSSTWQFWIENSQSNSICITRSERSVRSLMSVLGSCRYCNSMWLFGI